MAKKPLPKSANLFKTLLDQTHECLEILGLAPEIEKEFWNRVQSARRIYITGIGTSYPTALYLEKILRNKLEQPVYFLPVGSMIRQAARVAADDLLIIISHGLNRADSLIIINLVADTCPIIAITGNRTTTLPEKTLRIIVPPENEKIFCRPVSPVTTLVAIQQLIERKSTPTPKAIRINNNYKKLARWLRPEIQTIILYTADAYIAAQLWGIILREGAGMNVFTKDLEGYAHGYYGVDTADLTNRQYIILSSSSAADLRDLDRASPLYRLPGMNRYTYKASSVDPYETTLELFTQGFQLVYDIISETGFDMNNPNGVEENRKYHEYEPNRTTYSKPTN